MSAVQADGRYSSGVRLDRGSGGGILVGDLLAKGGQGFIFEVRNDADIVFKQFRPEVLAKSPELKARIESMVTRLPSHWREAGSGHVLLSWPLDTVTDGGRLVGLIMPRIDTRVAAELHLVSNPSDRRAPAHDTPPWVSGFTWRYLLQTASNLALATESLHQGGHIFGDFNERNILVRPDALVTLIDCDSMQIPDGHGGYFLCEVGRPEFTAPELLNRDLRKDAREQSSDLFPLAVHIHQLLFEGAHPFDGVWRGPGDKPKRGRLAIDGLYVYGGDPRLQPHQSAMPFNLVTSEIQGMFRRAFVTGSRDPALRPSGREWRTVLDAFAKNLRTCSRDQSHAFPDSRTTCPWCERETQLLAPRQTPLAPAQPANRTFQPTTPMPTTGLTQRTGRPAQARRPGPQLASPPTTARPASTTQPRTPGSARTAASNPRTRPVPPVAAKRQVPSRPREGGTVGALTFVFWLAMTATLVTLAGTGRISENFAGGNPLIFVPVAWIAAEATDLVTRFVPTMVLRLPIYAACVAILPVAAVLANNSWGS